jgi:hypothetical protein
MRSNLASARKAGINKKYQIAVEKGKPDIQGTGQGGLGRLVGIYWEGNNFQKHRQRRIGWFPIKCG